MLGSKVEPAGKKRKREDDEKARHRGAKRFCAEAEAEAVQMAQGPNSIALLNIFFGILFRDLVLQAQGES